MLAFILFVSTLMHAAGKLFQHGRTSMAWQRRRPAPSSCIIAIKALSIGQGSIAPCSPPRGGDEYESQGELLR